VIYRVPPAEIAGIWNKCEPLFQQVCDRKVYAPNVELVRQRVMSEAWVLWVSRDGDHVDAVMTTSIDVERDDTKTLRVEVLSGGNVHWASEMQHVYDYGRAHGCTRWCAPRARPGWRKKLPMARLVAVMLDGDILGEK